MFHSTLMAKLVMSSELISNRVPEPIIFNFNISNREKFMKKIFTLLSFICVLMLSCFAQRPEGGPPMMPVQIALDANHARTISSDEIANAPAALRKLDKNSDGNLTDDYRKK